MYVFCELRWTISKVVPPTTNTKYFLDLAQKMHLLQHMLKCLLHMFVEKHTHNMQQYIYRLIVNAACALPGARVLNNIKTKTLVTHDPGRGQSQGESCWSPC